jgi:hypothetical protein
MATGAVISALPLCLLLVFPLVPFLTLDASIFLTAVGYVIPAVVSLLITLSSAFLAGVIVWRGLPGSVGDGGSSADSRPHSSAISSVPWSRSFPSSDTGCSSTPPRWLHQSTRRSSCSRLPPVRVSDHVVGILTVGTLVRGLYERDRRQRSDPDREQLLSI